VVATQSSDAHIRWPSCDEHCILTLFGFSGSQIHIYHDLKGLSALELVFASAYLFIVMLHLIALFFVCAWSQGCIKDTDCGSLDISQSGNCFEGFGCQCGIGYEPSGLVLPDGLPSSCTFVCTPPAASATDSLIEPNVTVTAAAGGVFFVFVFACFAPWKAYRSLSGRQPPAGHSHPALLVRAADRHHHSGCQHWARVHTHRAGGEWRELDAVAADGQRRVQQQLFTANALRRGGQPRLLCLAARHQHH
jgi:hypothetical protein